MKIKYPPLIKISLILGSLIISQEMMSQNPRDGLRQHGDRYENTGIPNNCDDKIYAVTLSGNLIEMQQLDKKERQINILGNVFPFRCNAIVKGLNNKIYAVKADEQNKTAVYEYNVKSRLGMMTKWSLPPHSDGGWISGAVDSKGKLYFISTTMENLIRVDIRKVEPDKIWGDNISVSGWKKENCAKGCNFYINQQDELIVKENRGIKVWHISLKDENKVTKTEEIKEVESINPTNDILEYYNESGSLLMLLLKRDGISLVSPKKKNIVELYKTDTLKYGILTDLGGCNNFIKKEQKEEKIDEDDEKEDLIASITDVKESIRLKNIIFPLGESELLPESYGELDKLVRQLKKYPQVEILLEGHTDITGDAVENVQLSLERVKSCKKYLVNKGIQSQRIQTKGYGSAKPLKRSGSEKEREINRRVEFKIIKGIG
jgi:outer membrane protein OmpA-like peptidoglycan-associated protein